MDENKRLVYKYFMLFGKMPPTNYPQSAEEEPYISLIKKSLKTGEPYTEDDIPEVKEGVII